MSLFKKYNVNMNPTALPGEGEDSSLQAAEAFGIQLVEMAPDESSARSRAFANDFTQEHSHSGLHISSSMQISGNF